MDIKKTYIPAKFRNPKLVNSGGSNTTVQGGGSSTEGHTHNNKSVLDKITDATLEGANREIITTESESLPTDENVYSALKTKEEIDEVAGALNDKLSKIDDDEAQGIITFLRGLVSKGKSIFEDDAEFWRLILAKAGINVGQFSSGLFGSGATLRMNNGVSELEVDKLLVRMRAEFHSVLMHQARHVGGELVLSPADMICIKVEDKGSFWRCYFDRGEHGEVVNLFTNQDRARCQVFTGTGQKFYWRKVIAVGDDYIELSKTDMSPGVNDIPQVGDNIHQLGSNDPERQSAQIISTVGHDAPSWKQYANIDGYSLEDKSTTEFTSKGNKITGKTVFLSDGSNLEDWTGGIVGDITDAQQKALDAERKAQQAIQDAENAVSDYNAKFALQQQQIDGQISSWFYPYSPTLNNIPASLWTTNEEKDRHIGDTFTNTQNIPLLDAGKSWRFVKNGSVYEWTQISDSDALLALQKASEAQSTADGKSTTFLVQPSNYSLGDMWVLNADLTVNGTAYKQGDILTATQSSVTYNQAHWVKRVRYTDDSAVDELEIGTRNLILRSDMLNWRNIIIGIDEVGEYVEAHISNIRTKPFPSVRFETNTQYTFSGIVKKVSGEDNGLKFKYTDGTSSDIFRLRSSDFVKDFVATSDIGKTVEFIEMIWAVGGATRYYEMILVRGTKKADYEKAPEDIQAEIDDAKQKADDAQNSANTANSEVGSLNTYVNGAFKDGVISEAEAKSIATYINNINDSMAKAEASYQKVYTNSYLEGTAKTALSNAKINLWGQRDILLTTINSAILDGKTTIAEKNAVDSAFNTFNSLMSAFQSALEDANKAIQKKLDDISKGYVEELETGGRNLLPSVYDLYELTGTYGHIALTNPNRIKTIRVFDKDTSIDTTNIYFGFTGTGSGNDGGVLWAMNNGTISSNAYIGIKSTITTSGYFSYFPNTKATFDKIFSRFNIQIEEGNKLLLNYIPAPEDAQAQIDKSQADANIAKAKTQYMIAIDGGVIYSGMMKLHDAGTTNNESAGSSGIVNNNPRNPAFYAGGTYAEAIADLAKAIIRHDGSVKFTDGEFVGKISASSGDIGVLVVEENGNVAMLDPDTLIPRLVFSKTNLPLIGDLTGGVNSSGGMDVGSGYLSGSTGTSVTLPGSTNITKAGAEVTFSGATISLTGAGTVEPNGIASFIEVGLRLYIDDVPNNYLGGAFIHFTSPVGQETIESDVVNIPSSKFTLNKAGVVTLKLERVSIPLSNASLNSASITTSRLDWTHVVQGIKRQQYGLNGMMFFYSNNWFHFTEFGGLVLGGKTDMPGVLLSGTVLSGGGGENFWGAKQSGTPPRKDSTGRYTIHHTIGHNRYSVSVLPKSANRSCHIVSQSNTDFVVEFRTIGSSPALTDTAFTIQVTGDNYS